MSARAIVVGINQYDPDSGLTSLAGAVSDAAEFAAWALDPAGGNVSPADLLFWTYPAPPSPSAALAGYLTNPTAWPSGAPDFTRAPRAAEIKRAAFNLANQAGINNADRVYVFFAGHGLQTSPPGYEDEAQNCFLAGDYSPDTVDGLVPCSDLRRAVTRIGPAEAILIFDCCRSPMPVNASRPVLGSLQYNALGLNRICGIGHAAQPGQIAWEVPIGSPSRGAFTKLLICALRNLRDGTTLTSEQLEHYLVSAISTLVSPHSQVPMFEVLPWPQRRNLTLVQGPPLGPLPTMVVDLSARAPGEQIIVRDPSMAVFANLTAASLPAVLPAPIGTYSFETAAGDSLKTVPHLGPEVTDVVLA